MVLNAGAQAELCRLRRNIAQLEGRPACIDGWALGAAGLPAGSRLTSSWPQEGQTRFRLGAPALDAALGGGLPLARLHEVRAKESRDGGAASGFVMGLVARLAAGEGVPSVVFISEADARRETGGLYAPGLAALGLDPLRVVEVAVRTEREGLWAFEAALSCRGLGVAICELRQASLDLSATRRCALRAREAGVTGFLLRLGNDWSEPSAAELRFEVAPAPAGVIGRFAAGIGRMAWHVRLEKNRFGRTGAFTVEWNAHERSFADRAIERREEGRRADPQPLPAASFDRPSYPPAAAELLRRAS